MYVTNHGSNTSIIYYDWTTIGLLIVLSLLNFSGQISYVLACKYEQAARVALVGYMQTFLVMMYDVFIFGSVISIQGILGAALILGCNFILAVARFLKLID